MYKNIKYFAALAFLLLACHLSVLAQAQKSDKHLSAVFSYSSFYQSGTGPYIETYVSFDAWNLVFVPSDGKFQASVEMIITAERNDTIAVVKKYDLKSPKIDSPDHDHFNFIDMQRFALPRGIYNLTISLRDKNSSDSPTVVREQVALYYDSKRPALSSVQLMANVKPTATPNILSRGGYDMEPYVNDFLPEQVSQLNFYCELYNIDRELRDPNVYVVSFIEMQETGSVLEYTQTTHRMDRDSIIPIFGSIDITQLASGNYNLVVEIRNKSNDMLLFKRLPFFRSNPTASASGNQTPVEFTFASKLTNEAELNDYVEALYPLANELERRTIYSLIKAPGLEAKQKFLYNFWLRRDPLDPESLWNDYRKRIEYVNANFAWINTKGYQTDRGRVYLQYGPPDYVRDEKNFVSSRGMGSGVSIIRDSDPSKQVVGLDDQARSGIGQIFYLPYQLWRYNTLPGDDANRCFLFWDQFRSNQYQLLHSNAKGEVRDMYWERRLSQGQLPENAQGEVGDQFNRGH